MIEKYEDAGKKRPYLIFALTDETYSILCSDDVPENVDRHWYSFFVSLFNQSYWITGCVLGTVVTFDTAGIEFSMTALFVTVFVEQWLNTKNHLPCGFWCRQFFDSNHDCNYSGTVVGRKTVPKVVQYLGNVLPYAIMGMLVVYCLKGVSFGMFGGWLPELLSVVAGIK